MGVKLQITVLERNDISKNIVLAWDLRVPSLRSREKYLSLVAVLSSASLRKVSLTL